MKVLFLSHSFPYPLHEGVRLHVYQLIKELSKCHEIHLLTFIESWDEQKHLSQIQPFCRSIKLVQHTVPKQPWRRLWNMMAQPMPFSAYQFESDEMTRTLKQSLIDVQPDLVHVDFSVMAPYVNFLGKTPAVFFPHDAMSMLFERNVAQERSLPRKMYMRSQAKKMSQFESEFLPRFRKTIVVSPVDAKALQRRSPKSLIESVPNGVDAHYFRPFPDIQEKPIVLFRGILSFLPNLDAAIYSAIDIMPIVWQKRPETTFLIVGPNPPRELQQLATRERRISLVGFVEDIRIPTAEASVVVCPMRIGSGIKNKVLESMAMEKAIVATPMSLAGIEAKPDVHLKLGNAPELIAEQILKLLQDPEDRRKLGKAARAFVLESHTWEKHASQFSNIYKSAIAAPGDQ